MVWLKIWGLIQLQRLHEGKSVADLDLEEKSR